MKRALLLLFKISVTLALFYFLFSRLGFANIMGRVASADMIWLAGGLLVFLASMFLSAFQWDLLLKAQGISLGYGKIFSLYMVGHFFNNFLPGAMGGDVVKVYRLRRDIRRGKEGLAATFFDRFAGLFMLSLFALAASFYLYFFSHTHMAKELFLWLGLLFVVFLLSIALFFSRRVQAFVYDTLLKNINPLRLRDKVRDIHDYLHIYRGKRGLYGWVFGTSLVTQFLRIAVHYFAARAVGFEIAFVYFLIFVPIIALAASLPVSFGGLGVREGLGQVLFSTVSPSGPLAVATQFLASLIGIAVSLLGGLIFVAERRNGQEKHVKGSA
ncbi:MAG: lysylphosphatidylglycerol synthase transmembrane domain-containing protein [Fibrobacterota bacterium]